MARGKRSAVDRKVRYGLGGVVGEYVERVISQWLLVAPDANPAMLEMFRDRDAAPQRDLVPWAGEFAGKYLTAAVEVLRLTGDRRLESRIREFVPLLLARQAEDGYLGPWPKACRLANFVPHLGGKGMDTWDTWGHYHIMLGLLLWHGETGDRAALEAATRIGDLVCRRYLGRKKPRLVDTGSTDKNLAVVHSLALLYRRTGEARHLDMALQIVGEFAAAGPDGPLAGDYLEQALAGKEFFETPKPRWESLHSIMGLAELHRITGDDRFRRAFEHLWRSMARLDRHNNGGFTSGETATGDPYNPASIETCCTIAWIAMSVEMLKLTGEPAVADEMELSTLNSVIGMHSASGRWATYNTPMDGLRAASAHHIVFQSRAGSPELNCCSVNSPRGFGMIADWAAVPTDGGATVNYYGPSRMDVPLGGGLRAVLTQTTDYPVAGRVEIAVAPSRPADFALRFRIPGWSARTQASLNGRRIAGVAPGTYLEVSRRWRRGDRVRLDLDMSLRFLPGERSCAGLVSVYRGPLLLAYDHRYNLDRASRGAPRAREEDLLKVFPRETLEAPALDARTAACRRVRWTDWLPPLLLVEFPAADGGRVRLCDYGSAGESGTPYRTWLKR